MRNKHKPATEDFLLCDLLSAIAHKQGENLHDGWAALHGFLKNFRDLDEPSYAPDKKRLAELHEKLGKKQNGALEADFTSRGRPRIDDEHRETVRRMRKKHIPWKDIVTEMEKRTERSWTVDACRALLRNR